MMHTLNTQLCVSNAVTNTTTSTNFFTHIPHSKLYEKSLIADGIQPQDETFQYRARRIQKSQFEYSKLFGKLDDIISQLQDKYPRYAEQPLLNVDEDVVSVGTEPSSGASTSSETRTVSSCAQSSSRKRRICLEDDYIEIDEYEHTAPLLPIQRSYKQSSQSNYPKRLNCNPAVVILGPNGTQISAEQFDTITWTTAAVATRSLLAVVFSSEELATHTLTGKPSPAFYGRERPPKLQLNPLKTADIITCVRAMCDSAEREIRAAITTKCADTAKKFKRRSAKLNSSSGTFAKY